MVFKYLFTIGPTVSKSNKPRKSTATGTGGGSGLFESTKMQSLMKQLSHNPEILQTVIENPDMAASMIQNHPLLAGKPEMQNQLKNMISTFVQQPQNPELQVSKNIEQYKSCSRNNPG